MSDNLELTAAITTEEPEVAATLDELRYLVFQGMKGDDYVLTEEDKREIADMIEGGSGDFVLLRADSAGHVYNGEEAITGAQIYALAETGKAVFLWDEDGEYLYAFDTVHKGDVYFFMPAFDGNGFYAAVVSENDNECSFSARPAIPRASAADAGKVLTVDSNGAWTKQTPSGSPNAVLYTAQSLTDAQKEQARENIGITYMTAADIDEMWGSIDGIPNGDGVNY